MTGSHIDTLKPLHARGALPDRLIYKLNGKDNVIPLFENFDSNEQKYIGKEVWLEHPTHKSKVDIVAIPINQPSVNIKPPLSHTWSMTNIKITIAMDAFILGFPLNINAMGTPIWKRATIASEPMLNMENVPMFYVDTATRNGMSGAPVFLLTSGGYEDNQGKFWFNSTPKWKFLGVYASRSSDPEEKNPNDPFFAQLGKVYKADGLHEIICQNVLQDR